MLLRQLMRAMRGLHARGWLHYDIKPENVLLAGDGHVRLVDFGLAKEGVEHAERGASSMCGTYEYHAPEVLRRERQRRLRVLEEHERLERGVALHLLVLRRIERLGADGVPRRMHRRSRRRSRRATSSTRSRRTTGWSRARSAPSRTRFSSPARAWPRRR